MAKTTKDDRFTKGAVGGAAAKKLRSYRPPVIKATVTDALIQNAIRGNSGWCMVSESVKVAAPWALHVSSDLQTIRLTDPRKGLRYVYLTPRLAQVALIRFDSGGSLAPFVFTLSGGSTHTSFKRKVTETGKFQRVPAHPLGRRKILLRQGDQPHHAPVTVGGTTPKRVVQPGGLKPGLQSKAPLGTYRREFGMRAFVGGFDIKGGFNTKVPVGAPAISDR